MLIAHSKRQTEQYHVRGHRMLRVAHNEVVVSGPIGVWCVGSIDFGLLHFDESVDKCLPVVGAHLQHIAAGEQTGVGRAAAHERSHQSFGLVTAHALHTAHERVHLFIHFYLKGAIHSSNTSTHNPTTCPRRNARAHLLMCVLPVWDHHSHILIHPTLLWAHATHSAGNACITGEWVSVDSDAHVETSRDNEHTSGFELDLSCAPALKLSHTLLTSHCQRPELAFTVSIATDQCAWIACE
jgi:hypothetical protein